MEFMKIMESQELKQPRNQVSSHTEATKLKQG